MMDEKKLAAQLQAEGFSHTCVWADGPNMYYPDHTHHEETAHIILSGEMTLTLNGESHLYHAGERCDVPAGTVHSAVMGRLGCRYLIGERLPHLISGK
ncbi:MAG TPA: cupin domain-containing protein [Candidatus Dormibacteraeota bacterium]|jgi:mannose-6-phosphate isomerase-like protein (cupin superfamily)|nr:cupin domain-containing protein [Candidatus Dormibacteraeota bacterium]